MSRSKQYQLTPIEVDCFRLLYFVDRTSLWGIAIDNYWKAPTNAHLRELLSQLRSQAKDQPEVMEGILGVGLTTILITDKLWKKDENEKT